MFVYRSHSGEDKIVSKNKEFNDTNSQSFSVRFSNIFGAPKDIYIPGLDDDPKPVQMQGGQGQQQ